VNLIELDRALRQLRLGGIAAICTGHFQPNCMGSTETPPVNPAKLQLPCCWRILQQSVRRIRGLQTILAAHSIPSTLKEKRRSCSILFKRLFVTGQLPSSVPVANVLLACAERKSFRLLKSCRASAFVASLLTATSPNSRSQCASTTKICGKTRDDLQLTP